MISIGNTKIKDVFIGSQPIKAIYQGANLIWQRITKVLRTVTGDTSVTLTDTNDERSLVLLELDGKTSANLLQVSKNNYYVGYGDDNISIDNGIVTTNGSILMGFVVKVEPNTAYTFGATKENASVQLRVREYSAFPTSWTDNFIQQPINTNYNCASLTTTETTQYLVCGFYYNVATTVKNFMLVKGSYTETTMPPYQPYQSGSGDLTENLYPLSITEINADSVEKTYTLQEPIIEQVTLCCEATDDLGASQVNAWFYRVKYGDKYAYLLPSTFINYGRDKYCTVINASVDEPITQITVRKYITQGKVFNIQMLRGTHTVSNFPSYQPYGYKIGVLSYNSVIDNNVELTNSVCENGIYSFVTGSEGRIDIPLKAGTYAIFFNSTANLYLRNGKVASGTIKTAIANTYTTFNYTGSVDGYLRLSWFDKNAMISNLVIYESNKTPISLDTYIGATPLAQGEKVSVDWEKKEAWRGNHLPNEYQEVDYIQSDSNQYIDLGYKPTINTITEIDYQLTSFKNNNMLYGVRTNNTFYTSYINGNGMFSFAINEGSSGYWTSTNIVPDTNRHIQSLNAINGTMYIDGISVGVTTKRLTMTSTTSLLLFASNGLNGSTAYRANMKLYKFTIREGDTLVHQYIPCYRKSDNAIGLYDLISKAFYVNNGTGTFVKGNNVGVDLTPLNTNLLNAEATTFEGTTVITDTSTNKVSGISATYYASKE